MKDEKMLLEGGNWATTSVIYFKILEHRLEHRVIIIAS